MVTVTPTRYVLENSVYNSLNSVKVEHPVFATLLQLFPQWLVHVSCALSQGNSDISYRRLSALKVLCLIPNTFIVIFDGFLTIVFNVNNSVDHDFVVIDCKSQKSVRFRCTERAQLMAVILHRIPLANAVMAFE